METINKKRDIAIDYAKYVAAILVVAIHTSPLTNISTEINFFLTNIVCRVAVPFFAVCTGYYLTLAIYKQKQVDSILKAIKKIAFMYGKWSLFYLVIHLINWYKTVDFNTIITYTIGWCKSFFYSASYFHLWYLICIIYALIAFYIIIKNIPIKYFPFIIGFLWFIEVLEYGYYDFLSPHIQCILNHLFKLGSLFTGTTRLLPLLMVGSIIASSHTRKYNHLGTAISFILLVTEVYILRHIGGERFSFIIFTLPLAYFLFNSILHLESKHNNSKIFADMSMLIYCLHPTIIGLLKEINITNPFILFILTSMGCTIIGFAYYFKFKKQQLKNYLNH